MVKLLPFDHEVMGSTVQVLETISCRNAVKDCVHKTQCGQTVPWTLRKLELHAPGCPLLMDNFRSSEMLSVGIINNGKRVIT
jgi:hypothetical protein